MSVRRGAAAAASLKSAFRVLVRAVGGVDAAAACSRAGRSLISEYQTFESERFPPVDVVLDIEEIAGSPEVTAAMARALGFRLVPAEPRAEGELCAALARIGRDCGEIFAAAAHVLSGGGVSAAERAELVRDLDDLQRVAGEALALVEREKR
ncbi:MAG: hypothetical protein KGH75_00870 [Rhodospirillales bacterium]|nr:hypothetical protein [Rhodospirillales bacterium]